MPANPQPATLTAHPCSYDAMSSKPRSAPASMVLACGVAVLLLGLAVALVIAAVQGRVNVEGVFDINLTLSLDLGNTLGP